MQKLQFERAWDKTISQKDRQAIEHLFQQSVEQIEYPISCAILRQAINHKDNMLLTVLIHNFSDQEIAFEDRKVHCQLDEGHITQNFTIHALRIPAKTSMPWTFIFHDSCAFLDRKLLHILIEG